MRQTWIPITIFIPFVIGMAIVFPTLGYTILMLWICKKSFLSTVFLVINVLSWIRTNFDTHNNLLSFSQHGYNHVLYIGIHDVDVLDLQENLCLYHFLIIKVHLWNETNMDTHNNLHSFCSWHYNHVLHIGIHDIDALDFQEKLSFNHFPYK